MTTSVVSHRVAAPSPLLVAKLSPPTVRTPVIRRPRLLDLVSRGVEGPLTVVTGPAGSGKSLLLASWTSVGAAPGPVAWLNLDDVDDQPGVFWTYAVAALRRAGVALPDDVGQPMRPDEIDRPFLARVADGLAGGHRPVVLVLDQFDVITEAGIKQGLEFVLRNASPWLRVVLLSRETAPLPLHRFELRGELTRLDGAELAFSAEEAEALLRQHGVRLPDPALTRLLDQVGGWAAALRLSAVAMQRRAAPEEFVAALPGSDATLTAFLLQEVLGSQSEEVRQFLLRTSIVEAVSPDLADVLADRRDAAVLLPALHAGNLLVKPLDEAASWYQYHPLFRRLLRTELDHQHPGMAEELHRRAAAWFEQVGMTPEAVEAAAAGSDWQRAASAVVRGLAVGALFAGQDSGRLNAALAGLPSQEPGPTAAVVRAAIALTRSDLDTCRDQLRQAAPSSLDGADGADGADDEATLRASVAVLAAIVARSSGDVDWAEEALRCGERELGRIPHLAGRHPEMLALLLSNAGTAQLWAGRFDVAEDTLRRGLAVADRPGCEYPRLNLLGRMASLEFRAGHLRRAARLGQEALSLAEESGLPVDHRTGADHVILAAVAVEWNDRAAARRYLDAAERTVNPRQDPFVATIVPLLRAWVHAGRRDFRRSLAALTDIPTTVAGRPLPDWIAARIDLTKAFLHLARNDAASAAAALDRSVVRGPEWLVAKASVAAALHDRSQARELLEQALDGGVPDVDASRVGAWLLTARLAVEDHDPPAAEEALGRALALARPEGYRRAFFDAGPWVRDLLRANPALAVHHRWLGPPLIDPSVACDVPDNVEDAPIAVVERLTEREHTVLARLAQGLSTEDVAADLYLSINTVKTHQKNLYRKLGVVRRNDAVHKARRLQLI